MICPNCGRRNSTGATFCSRCRQRLPLAAKLNGNHRRTVVVEPRGGGGSGAIVLGVALVAGFLFIGGAAAIYLSNPPAGPDGTDVALVTPTPSLPPFVQPTATPSPTPSPTFILLPSDSPTPSFTPLPTVTASSPPSAAPTDAPRPPTPVPTTAPVTAKFSWSQDGKSLTVSFVDRSTGGPTERAWDFGDGGTSAAKNPSHTYAAYDKYTVTLVVTGTNGAQSFKQREVTVQAPPCNDEGNPPGCIPTPAPSATPAPTPAPTATPSPTNATPAATEAPQATENPTPGESQAP